MYYNRRTIKLGTSYDGILYNHVKVLNEYLMIQKCSRYLKSVYT